MAKLKNLFKKFHNFILKIFYIPKYGYKVIVFLIIKKDNKEKVKKLKYKCNWYRRHDEANKSWLILSKSKHDYWLNSFKQINYDNIIFFKVKDLMYKRAFYGYTDFTKFKNNMFLDKNRIKNFFKKTKELFTLIKYKINKLKYNYKVIVYLINDKNDKIKKWKYKCNYHMWYKNEERKWLVLSCASHNDISNYRYFDKKYFKISADKIHSIEIINRKKSLEEHKSYADYTKAINNPLLEEDLII